MIAAKNIEKLTIIYPGAGYDLESVLKVADLFKCDEFIVCMVEDFDRINPPVAEPVNMPYGIDKVQLVIGQKLNVAGAIVINTDDEDAEEVEESDSEWYDSWTVEFSLVEKLSEKKKLKKVEPRTTRFTLHYIFDLDDYDLWPELGPFDILIHTNGILDPEKISDIVENPYNVNVYTNQEMAQLTWRMKKEDLVYLDEETTSSLCYLGNLGDFNAGVDSSSE